MRFHRRMRPYLLRQSVERARAMFVPEALVAARLDPSIAWRYEGLLELVFERDGQFGILANIVADGSYLVQREAPPLSWPSAMRDYVTKESLDAIEMLVEPWLASRVLARFENDEAFKFFRDEPRLRSDFERARDYGLIGAAPVVHTTRSIAPYVYSARFSANRRVGIDANGGANGAAILSGRAGSVDFRSNDPEKDAFVRRWFSLQEIGQFDSRATYDVGIVEGDAPIDATVRIHADAARGNDRRIRVARPLPTSVMVSFDVDDSIDDGSFGITAPLEPLAPRSLVSEPSALGGSAGRIALVVREDWDRSPDADTDTIRIMQRRLAGEGFDVRVVEAWSHLEPSDADLVHVIGSRDAALLVPKLERFREAGVPIVAMPYLDDPNTEAPWGAQITLFSFRGANDDAMLDQYLAALERRRLNADGVPPCPASVAPQPDPAMAKLLELAGAVIVSGNEEERFIRERYGYAGPVLAVPPFVAPGVPADVAYATGGGDFALFHGPIDSRSGLLMLVMAAEEARIPLVVTGPVASAEAVFYLHAFGGNYVRYIPPAQLSPEEHEGLYARARVYVDIAWAGRGLSRFARAAGYGASLVGTPGGYAKDLWSGLLTIADPAGLSSIAGALRHAWDTAPDRRSAFAGRTAERCDQTAALVGTVTAYQQAAATLAVP